MQPAAVCTHVYRINTRTDIDLIEMELIVRVAVMLLLALIYIIGPCNCSKLCSPDTYGNNLHLHYLLCLICIIDG
jgi:hypothetical protein